MKKIFLLFFLTLSMTSFAQETVAWDYPVKPGTAEWKNFQTGKEMILACQIPDSILKILPTRDLSILCLEYPMKINAFLVDNLQTGFQNVYYSFNGIRELFSRSDAGQVLLNLYKDVDMESKTIRGTNIKELDVFKTCFLELMLAQEKYRDKLTKEEKVELMELAKNNLDYKIDSGKSLFRQKTSAVILSRIYVNVCLDNEPVYLSGKRLDVFNKHLFLSDSSVISDIKQTTDNFINTYKK